MNQSSYVYSGSNPSGLGRMALRRELLAPVSGGSSMVTTTTRTSTGGSTATRSRDAGDVRDRTIHEPEPQPTPPPTVHVQPDPTEPKTGGSHPVEESLDSDDLVDNSVGGKEAPFFQKKDDRYIIGGKYEVTKKQAMMYGGGSIGVLILLRLF